MRLFTTCPTILITSIAVLLFDDKTLLADLLDQLSIDPSVVKNKVNMKTNP
jgi:acyl CoA:acetate/3-ketoacid CoA transferase beta subunit